MARFFPHHIGQIVLAAALLGVVEPSARAYSFLSSKAAPAKIEYRVRPLWSLQMKRDRFFKYQKVEMAGPFIDGGELIVPSDSGYLYSVARETGKVRWIFKTAGRLHAAPWLSASLLYMGDTEGFLYAINRADGKELWRTHVGGEIVTTPAVSGDRIYVGDAAARLVALKRADGSFLWQGVTSRPPGGISYYSGTPTLLAAGGLIAGAVDGHYFRTPLTGGMPDWIKPPPVKRGVVTDGIWDLELHDGDVMVTGSRGTVCRIDPSSGSQKWCAEVGDGARLSLDADKMIAANFSGDLHFLDPVSGARLGSAHGLEGPLTAPAAGEDFVAVGSPRGGLLLVNPASGALGLRRPCKGGVSASPAAEGDRVYFVTGMGRITALQVAKRLPPNWKHYRRAAR